MQDFLSKVSIKVNKHIYLKNPESSDLGKKIVAGSIELIQELGIDQFNFRKLGQHISTTEASIYRYFENKHKLLLYLTAWYWRWMESRLFFATTNIDCPLERLRRAVATVSEKVKQDSSFTHINEVKLQQIIIAESTKVYFTKSVEEEDRLGVYGSYKQLIEQISFIISEINPTYKYPNMLISTVVEGALHQRYFAEHIPSLTDSLNDEDAIINFYTNLVINAIKN